MDKWLALRVETGGLAPRPHRIRGHSHKVTDLDAFREWVKSETPVERLEELIPRFEAHYGTPISYSNLHKWLQRIGWSHKKNHQLPISQTSRTLGLPMAAPRIGRGIWAGSHAVCR